jgi:amino acid permease
MPYAFLHLGVPGATVTCLVGAWATHVSCRLFLAARDTIPANIQSYFELGFALYGRASIYYISAIIGLYAWGLMVIYFIVFADITKSLVTQLMLSDKPSFFTSRSCYCIILALALFP